jgi:putative two-component system response regulator
MSTAEHLYDQFQSSPLNSVFHPSRILIVNAEVIVREALVRKLSSLGYACECCESNPLALEMLAGSRFDLVLADVSLPAKAKGNFLKEAMKICSDAAIILIAPVVDIDLAVASLKEGAYDYITKPFTLEEVSISVSRALEKRRLLIENRNYQRTLEEQVASRTGQLKEALGVLEHTYYSTLVALSRALDSRDVCSDGHSLRISAYAERLAQQMGLDESEIRTIEQGALLHDIGKIGIPDELLRKSGRLTESEWSLVRQHPEIGYRILSSIKFLKGAAQLVLHHHEQYDGNGYPLHLKKDEINLGARVFAVAEALDDFTSGRPFGPARSCETAIDEIKRMSEAQLDPTLVHEFLKVPVSEWENIRQELAANTKPAGFLRIGAKR